MTGIALIGLIWGILSLTSGDDVGFGIIILIALFLGVGVGLWIVLDDAKRKKDGERCMRNWKEYKRNMANENK